VKRFSNKKHDEKAHALSGLFHAIGGVLKAALANPIIRGIIQIVGCAVTAAATAGMGCVAITGALTLAAPIVALFSAA
jgi:hypothetical protein